MRITNGTLRCSSSRRGNFILLFFAFLVQSSSDALFCNAEVPVGSYGTASESSDRNSGIDGGLWKVPTLNSESGPQANEIYLNYRCPVGDLSPVMLEEDTGTYVLFRQSPHSNETEENLVLIDGGEKLNRSRGNIYSGDNIDSSKEKFGADDNSVLDHIRAGTRRYLRGAKMSRETENRILVSTPIFVASGFVEEAPTSENSMRFLSTYRKNSLVADRRDLRDAKNSNDATSADLESYSTSELLMLRPCGCFDEFGTFGGVSEGSDSDINQIGDPLLTFCPASSDWCAYTTSYDTDASSRSPKLECFSMAKDERVALNAWPLLWIMYAVVLCSFCCSFQGRILLDFVRGTILYYVCGCGDRYRNRQMRNINRYNQFVVQEILDEERVDRENVVRHRTRNQNGNWMNFDPPRIPPTITTSTHHEGLSQDNDNTEGSNPITEGRGDHPDVSIGNNRLVTWWRGVVWPWQTSWNRYIKYNLLLRVEWMAIRDEIAFIESRQERGLPHAIYEMKTRRWSSTEEDTSRSSCCRTGNEYDHSIDAPHCTICFTELEDGDRVGDLGCIHVFHVDCLKMWIQKRNSCPLCNIPIANRRRLSSEELLVKNNNNDNRGAQNESPQEGHRNNHGRTIEEGSLEAQGSSLSPTIRNTDHGSPSNHQRRLSHLPVTPSTIADDVDAYSTFSEEIESVVQLDDDDDESTFGRRTLEIGEESGNGEAEQTTVAVESSLLAATTRLSASSAVTEENEDKNSIMSIEDEYCNIDDFLLSKDNQGRSVASDHSEAASFASSARAENSVDDEVDLPSPPRHVRRLSSEAPSSSVMLPNHQRQY